MENILLRVRRGNFVAGGVKLGLAQHTLVLALNCLGRDIFSHSNCQVVAIAFQTASSVMDVAI